MCVYVYWCVCVSHETPMGTMKAGVGMLKGGEGKRKQ